MSMKYLLFNLCATVGAFGSPSRSASNEARKPTEFVPTKSALVGLLGACAGVGRDRLHLLDQAFSIAVLEQLRPYPLASKPDYHTISRGKKPHKDRTIWTRFEELRAAGQSGSILSWREYWSHGLWTVVVVQNDPGIDLAAWQEALTHPRYEPYVGRRSCHLALPLAPQVVDVDGGVREALAQYQSPALTVEPFRSLLSAPGTTLYFDDGFPGAPTSQRTVERYDRIVSAAGPLRRFASRLEHQATVSGGKE